jgi:hypothetical protein
MLLPAEPQMIPRIPSEICLIFTEIYNLREITEVGQLRSRPGPLLKPDAPAVTTCYL